MSQNNNNALTVQHEEERKKDTSKILDSNHPKRIVVAGPGTGKSFLFQEAIKKEMMQGKKKFLALTFIGKLCDELADDLASLAETRTLHSFAREFVLSNLPEGWEYYPQIIDIIKHDLEIKNITDFEIGDSNYKQRTEYYRAIGNDDVMHYAVEICKKDENKIPIYDMLLVDEYQDLNEKEAEFIDLLVSKNKSLIVGDDDQALYEFKGSYSKFIRSKFHDSENEFEKHMLKYCSRCTSVIVSAFNNIVEKFDLNGKVDGRVEKKYICYTPEKEKDSKLNPKIIIMKDIPDGMFAFKIFKELEELMKIQKIKTVLIIGEARTCKKTLSQTARLLAEMGFKSVSYQKSVSSVYSFKDHLLQGYKILYKGKNLVLGWRLIIDDLSDQEKDKLILDNFEEKDNFLNSIPEVLKKEAFFNARILKRIIESSKSGRDSIAKSSIEKLENKLAIGKKESKDIFMDEVRENQKSLPRPLRNLDINVCSILGSKGLGADIVFVIGFDQGKIPAKSEIQESEIYQFLVALTRAKKRIYLINTRNKQLSKFTDSLGNDNYEEKT